MTRNRLSLLSLLILPAVYFALTLVLRENGGPFWIWHIVDPSYYYLFDALNLVNLTPPGHPYHPGTPVQVLGALALKSAYPLTDGPAITQAVMADPESHLRLISTFFIILNTLGLLALGATAYFVLGSPLLAWILQTAPFLSKVILKNAYHAKPEALLVLTVLALSMVILRALGKESLNNAKNRYALAFGVIAGFGVAVKITAAPIFLLPVFLLGNVRALGLYGAVSFVSLVLFTSPIMGSYDVLFAWLVKTGQGSGDYGSGAQTVIDFARYPKSFFKLLSRPLLHVPLLLTVIALIAAWRARRAGKPVPPMETRFLGGYALAIMAEVALVAKQPVAYYMVPAYMLSPLALVVLARFTAKIKPWRETARAYGRKGLVALFILLIAASGMGSWKLNAGLKGKAEAAASLDDRLFEKCSRIFFFPASNRNFALPLADWWTGGRFKDRVAERIGANDFWFEQNTMELRDAYGPRDIKKIIENSACVYLRGGHGGPIKTYLSENVPGFKYASSCSTRDEIVLTSGVDCKGNLQANQD